MAAGVASGLQNRFGVRKASRVGSIPTRSRRAAASEPGRVGRTARKPCFRRLLRLAVAVACLAHAPMPSAAQAQETDRPAAADTLAAAIRLELRAEDQAARLAEMK